MGWCTGKSREPGTSGTSGTSGAGVFARSDPVNQRPEWFSHSLFVEGFKLARMILVAAVLTCSDQSTEISFKLTWKQKEGSLKRRST